MSKLYIDADACPVKAEAEKVATRHKVQMFIVSNGGLRPSANPWVETIIVPDGADIADDWIAERIGTGDVAVTTDIPLAQRCVDAGAIVVKPNGELLDRASIGAAAASRDLMTALRAADPFRQGGGKPFSKADKSRFLDMLDRQLRRAGKE